MHDNLLVDVCFIYTGVCVYIYIHLYIYLFIFMYLCIYVFIYLFIRLGLNLLACGRWQREGACCLEAQCKDCAKYICLVISL